MSRYIDADRVMAFWKLRADKHEMYDAMAFYEDLDLTPTADVAEVVRCKDCRYVFKEDEYSYWCNGFTSPMRLVTPKTFCSHGRRR